MKDGIIDGNNGEHVTTGTNIANDQDDAREDDVPDRDSGGDGSSKDNDDNISNNSANNDVENGGDGGRGADNYIDERGL